MRRHRRKTTPSPAETLSAAMEAGSPIASKLEEALEYVRGSVPANTRRAYSADLRHFSEWCAQHSKSPLPADDETVAAYITALAKSLTAATIQRRLAAISKSHLLSGFDSPTKSSVVRTVWAGIRRTHGTAQAQKKPLSTDLVRKILSVVPDTLAGRRDRALLILGFVGGLRRSELVGIRHEHIELGEDGLAIAVPHHGSGRGRTVIIPYGENPATCPVKILEAWLNASGITTGPLFRWITRYDTMMPNPLTSQSVALILKRYIADLGLKPEKYSGHSLRSGFATSAAMKGAGISEIQNQTGHKSLETLRKYIRDGRRFKESAAKKLGL